MSLSIAEAIYVTLVTGVGGYLFVKMWRLIGSSQRQRVGNVRRRRRFDAVETSAPIEDPTSVALRRGVESIEHQFSVVRRFLLPVILLFVGALVAPVFLGRTSATTASIIGAVLAAVLGLALRPLLENAIAGLVIGFSRLVRIGDTVTIDNQFGTIEDITMTHTTVKLWDWRRFLVPNNRMLQIDFVNHSLYDSFHWAHVEFSVAPDADLDLVRRIALRAPLGSPHFANHEEPKFWVTAIEKDAIWGWVVAWADSPSAAWSLKNDIREQLLADFARHGIARSLQRHVWTPETKAGVQEPLTQQFEPGAACEAMPVASPPTAAGYA